MLIGKTFRAPPKFIRGAINAVAEVRATLTVLAVPDERIIIDKWRNGFTSMWLYDRDRAVDWDGDFAE